MHGNTSTKRPPTLMSRIFASTITVRFDRGGRVGGNEATRQVANDTLMVASRISNGEDTFVL